MEEAEEYEDDEEDEEMVDEEEVVGIELLVLVVELVVDSYPSGTSLLVDDEVVVDSY